MHSCSLRAIGSSSNTKGAAFRRVERNGIVLNGRLGTGVVARIVKQCAHEIGLDPNGFGGHSLRAGYVTTAAVRELPIWAIKRQTGHSSQTVLETYMCDETSRALRTVLNSLNASTPDATRRALA
jgi:integrase